MSATALLLIDAQNSFTARDYWQAERYQAFVPPLRRLIDAAHAAAMPLVRILHAEPGGGTPFDPALGLVTPLLEFTDRAAVTFTKRVHNAFTDTGLEAWLREHGIRRVVICGIRTEQCCETTARMTPRPGGRDGVTFSARCGSS
ncbi:cysteine hydrolase family protein [Halotalea alkalilenta]|uniref:Isochorismatase-like domain-containing protein n=1 Tax=Halotalea alkalilenta TaxID=376489 RepID=A0A172YIC8_9GAMM|nr:isochorismatase family cysteine hydrolase [Halotalea alkalilenta]ANF58795.1 hypothetical protein A5892_16085 [Halotalea alkalilenta]